MKTEIDFYEDVPRESDELIIIKTRWSDAEKELKKLAKKSDKYGNEKISWIITEEFNKVKTVNNGEAKIKFKIPFLRIKFSGLTPKVEGWEFLARFEFLSSGVLRYVSSEHELDYRFSAGKETSHCEHCNSNRWRNDIFVVRNMEDGKQMQVGRSCLKAFVGKASINQILRKYEFTKKLSDGFTGWSMDPMHSTEYFIVLIHNFIRTEGWRSKDADTSTAWEVLKVMTEHEERKRFLDITEADVNEARKTIEWVKTEPNNSDWINNLKVLYNSEIIDDIYRRRNMIASGVTARLKSEERLEAAKTRFDVEKQSAHIGTIKEKRTFITTLKKVHTFEGEWGLTFINIMNDEDNNIIVYKGGKKLAEEGDKIVLTATIKDHTEYKEIKQTIIQRPKILEGVSERYKEQVN